MKMWKTAALAFSAYGLLSLAAALEVSAGGDPRGALPEIDTSFPATADEWRARYPELPLDDGLFASPDFDGDGVGDLIFQTVGFDLDAPRVGQVDVLSGWLADEIFSCGGEAANDLFGIVAVSVGDINGDGVQDLAISAPASGAAVEEGGRVYIHSGDDGTLIWRITGQVPFGGFGWSIAPLGDINGDNIDDFAVGAPFGGATGRVNIFHGEPAVQGLVEKSQFDAQLTLFGEGALDLFGFSVAKAGDFNGDSVEDIIVGAPLHDRTAGEDPNNGAAYVYSGQDGSLLAEIKTDAVRRGLGFAVGGVGDVNGDGFADVGAASPGEILVNEQTAEVMDDSHVLVFGGSAGAGPGSPALLESDAVSTLNAADDAEFLFGAVIEGANDVTGDGVNEALVDSSVIVTDPVDGSLRYEIQTYIYGGDGSLVTSFRSDEDVPEFPMGPEPIQQALPFTGDVDGDGVVGADDLKLVTENIGRAGALLVDGDVSGDGVVDLVDLKVVMRAYGLEGAARLRGDFDGNSIINVRDLRVLLKSVQDGLPYRGVFDLDGDGDVDVDDAAAMMEASGGLIPTDELCDELDLHDLSNDLDECRGGGLGDGRLPPVAPDPRPRPGPDCDELPRENAGDCTLWALCVTEPLAEELRELEDELEELEMEEEELFRQLFQLLTNLIALQKDRDDLYQNILARLNNDEKTDLRRNNQNVGMGAMIGGGTGVLAALGGLKAVAKKPSLWVVGAGAFAGGAIGVAFEGWMDDRAIRAHYAQRRSDYHLAFNGINPFVGGLPEGLLAAGQAVVAAAMAVREAEDALRDLQDEIDMLQAEIEAKKLEIDQALDDAIDACLAQLPGATP